MENEIGCWGKVNPSLKYRRDCERLLRGLREGEVSCLGTDHGTGGRTRNKKEYGKGKYNNIWDSRIGIRGGMEHLLPVMMTYVNSDKISIENMVKMSSTNTAKVFGLYPRKGVIATGSDADIVLVDQGKEKLIDKDFYHCLCEVSIYEGWKIKGMARYTIVRGEVMMEEYQTSGSPKHGKYIARRSKDYLEKD
jgi:dihydroorotase-like cyclic amidohydrolase